MIRDREKKKSPDMDPYLRLEGSSRKQLAFDDDSGGDFNARITFAYPKTTSYRIITTTLKGSPRSPTGQFTLKIQQQ